MSERCEMPTKSLPAASLRTEGRLPAGQMRPGVPNYLICMVVWSIEQWFVGAKSRFLPVLRETPGRPAWGSRFDFGGARAFSVVVRDTGIGSYEQQASGTEIQDQSPPRGKSVGPAEEPAEPPRIRPRPARPAPQEALRLRNATRRQAEAQGLLCEYRRAPIPATL